MTHLQDFSYVPSAPLENRWTDVLRADALVHLAVMGSIVAGTFQGYLKDRIPGPVPYALAELFFIAGALVWFATLAIRRDTVRGPGFVPAIVLFAIFLPAIYLLHPGTPLLIELAGLRGWAEFPVACLMALTVIRTPGQARAYVALILILCAITAVYGIRQFQVGPEAVLGVSELAEIRHGTSVFFGEGERQFRAYSTFTFPAPFAMMMVFGILLATGGMLSHMWSTRRRVLTGLLVLLLFMGMTVSGTRAAMIVLLLGLGILAWYRRVGMRMLVLMPLLFAGVYAGSLITAGRLLERFQSVFLTEGLLWLRVYAPITIAGRALSDALFGFGLGRSGVGVPFQIYRSYPAGFFRGSDGDIGRAAVEMGVFGLVLLAVVLLGLLPAVMRAVRQLRGTDVEDVALGVGALVLASGVTILVGSPLSSVPHATIWWFMLGVLLKLWMIHDEQLTVNS